MVSRRGKEPSPRPSLSIPRGKVQKIKEALRVVGGYHRMPRQWTPVVHMRAMFRGWCTYYRYATAPQATCSALSRYTGWRYAHYVARKHRRSIAQMIRQEQQAEQGWDGSQRMAGRSNTFRVFIDKKDRAPFNLFPPRTGHIRALASTGQWTVDLKASHSNDWQSGRSLATRTAALERAKGTCERCGENPAAHVHHTVPLRGKTLPGTGYVR